eukprot:s184_g4.t1
MLKLEKSVLAKSLAQLPPARAKDAATEKVPIGPSAVTLSLKMSAISADAEVTTFSRMSGLIAILMPTSMFVIWWHCQKRLRAQGCRSRDSRQVEGREGLALSGEDRLEIVVDGALEAQAQPMPAGWQQLDTFFVVSAPEPSPRFSMLFRLDAANILLWRQFECDCGCAFARHSKFCHMCGAARMPGDAAAPKRMKQVTHRIALGECYIRGCKKTTRQRLHREHLLDAAIDLRLFGEHGRHPRKGDMVCPAHRTAISKRARALRESSSSSD